MEGKQQVVYLCGCEPVKGYRKAADAVGWGDGTVYDEDGVGVHCNICNSPVRAVNITEMEAKLARVEALSREWAATPDDAAIFYGDLITAALRGDNGEG